MKDAVQVVWLSCTFKKMIIILKSARETAKNHVDIIIINDLCNIL